MTVKYIKRNRILFPRFKTASLFLMLSLMFTLAGCGREKAQQQQASGQMTEEASSVQAASAETAKTSIVQESPSAAPAGENGLQAVFLKVGKADAIIVRCGEETMVIDCGEEEDGQEVLDYLAGQGIQKVSVLLITHFDKDHVGGADTVIKGIQTDRVLQPAYEGVSKAYTEFEKALAEEEVTPENVTDTLYFDLGAASVKVQPPASYEIPQGSDEYDNDFSLITTLEYGGRRFLFAGDIEEKRIREWLAQGSIPPCDVLKVPHHGVYNSALEELFQELSPRYAVICDSKKNPADSRTMELLDKYGAACLETKDGDITILSDGEDLRIQ